jgi:hypothetical protein
MCRYASNVPVLGLNVRRVLNVTPRQLRESVTRLEDTLLLHLERRLLAHRRVKAVASVLVGYCDVHVVARQQSREEQNVAPHREHVVGRIGARHVQDGVAVGERTGGSAT